MLMYNRLLIGIRARCSNADQQTITHEKYNKILKICHPESSTMKLLRGHRYENV